MVKLAHFPRELRLLTPLISFVFQQPQQRALAQITILGRLNSLGHPRIGLTVAKIRRVRMNATGLNVLTRESRLRQHGPAMDFVVRWRKGVADLDNRARKRWKNYSAATVASRILTALFGSINLIDPLPGPHCRFTRQRCSSCRMSVLRRFGVIKAVG